MKRLFTLVLLLLSLSAIAQKPRTVGLKLHKYGTLDGYVLFAPMQYTTTYLVDRCGKQIHSWSSQYTPGLSAYILPDGSLLRAGQDTSNHIFNAGGRGGIIEKIDWSGKVSWHCRISDSFQCSHHDITPLPNGNILVIVWEKKSDTTAKRAGRSIDKLPKSVWSEKVLEIKPRDTASFDVVWEWHVWDHLVQQIYTSGPNFDSVAQHPELININYTLNGPPQEDWLHINGITYNPALDQVMLTIHNFSEFWIIDHSTTSAEAATHRGGKQNKGGDLLYRWGNPAAYDRGSPADQMLFQAHDANWIPDKYPHGGKIIIFNNGLGRPGGLYSSVEIIAPPLTNKGGYTLTTNKPYLPKASEWRYTDSVPGNFYSSLISGAQMLVNGNVLICNGIPGVFFEIDSSKHSVWQYDNPVTTTGPVGDGGVGGTVFRCTFYSKNYQAFSGKTLIPGDPVEHSKSPYSCYMPADTVRPLVKLKGNKSDTVEVFNFYSDKGATAHSNFSGVAQTVSGTFYSLFPDGKPTRLGNYTIVYVGTDSSGLADSITRTITVVDKIPPVIHLTGDTVVSVCRWAKYVDKGFSLSDNYWNVKGIHIDTFGTFYMSGRTNSPGTYNIRYRAKDSSGNIAYSGWRRVSVLQAGTVQCKTGIEEGLSLDQYIKVYPNPTSGEFTVAVNLPDEGRSSITVTNMLGKLIVDHNIENLNQNTFSVNLSGYPAGIYLLNVNTSGGSITSRVLLTR